MNFPVNYLATDSMGHCCWCHQKHQGIKCALVKRYEFYPDGTLKLVEFYAPGDGKPAITLTVPPNETH
jgi:hypothetical protein